MKILCLNRNPFFLFLICIFLLGAAVFSACTGPASTPPPMPSQTPSPMPTPTPTPAPAPTPTPTPTPTPAPPLEDEWSADGIIRVREYHGSNIYGDYEIHWRSDDQYVYIGIKAKTSGFVAVAVQPGSRMKDADMIFGFVKNGKVEVYDLYSTENFGPHSLDTKLGGADNILEYSGKEEGGFTTIEFKRALNTDDDYDIPLSKGVNKIIWAYGSSDSLTVKHSTRGYGEINL